MLIINVILVITIIVINLFANEQEYDDDRSH